MSRHEGRVVFVRHTLPGERVRARVTAGGPGDRFWRADAVEVLEASPDRVAPPCPYAGPGRCGGCDWQHVEPAAQRGLKAAVVAEQMRRLAGVEVSPVVEVLPGSPGGLGWRTRVTFSVDGTDAETIRLLKPIGIREFHVGTAVRAGRAIDGDVCSKQVREVAQMVKRPGDEL